MKLPADGAGLGPVGQGIAFAITLVAMLAFALGIGAGPFEATVAAVTIATVAWWSVSRS